MSFTKQTPTKPGDYRWRISADEPTKRFAIVKNMEGKLYATLCGNPTYYRVEDCGGEWEGPLVTAEEAQADAAAMREALETLIRFQCYCNGKVKCGHCKARAALSGHAGHELLAELQRLRAWKAEQLAVESQWDTQAVGEALGLSLGVDIRSNILPKIKELTDELAKAQAQCAAKDAALESVKSWSDRFQEGTAMQRIYSIACEALSPDCGRDYVHRSEVQLGYEEGWRDGCNMREWITSRARKVATGELK